MKIIVQISMMTLAFLLSSLPMPRAAECTATTAEEWEKLLASSPQECTFIRTSQDWRDYKAGARFPGHPLSALSSAQLAEFEKDLWIRDGGVVSMNVGILEKNLSARDYERVLRAFGLTTILVGDYKN